MGGAVGKTATVADSIVDSVLVPGVSATYEYASSLAEAYRRAVAPRNEFRHRASSRMVALACASHPRLGAASPARCAVDLRTLALIWRYLLLLPRPAHAWPRSAVAVADAVPTPRCTAAGVADARDPDVLRLSASLLLSVPKDAVPPGAHASCACLCVTGPEASRRRALACVLRCYRAPGSYDLYLKVWSQAPTPQQTPKPPSLSSSPSPSPSSSSSELLLVLPPPQPPPPPPTEVLSAYLGTLAHVAMYSSVGYEAITWHEDTDALVALAPRCDKIHVGAVDTAVLGISQACVCPDPRFSCRWVDSAAVGHVGRRLILVAVVMYNLWGGEDDVRRQTFSDSAMGQCVIVFDLRKMCLVNDTSATASASDDVTSKSDATASTDSSGDPVSMFIGESLQVISYLRGKVTVNDVLGPTLSRLREISLPSTYMQDFFTAPEFPNSFLFIVNDYINVTVTVFPLEPSDASSDDEVQLEANTNKWPTSSPRPGPLRIAVPIESKHRAYGPDLALVLSSGTRTHLWDLSAAETEIINHGIWALVSCYARRNRHPSCMS
ncbi:hypothetical protein Pelo_6291 [Pelomyxa schiedti]|nr:hypothetical protein Pelo_6291 [Pelomyxa schiedti]